MTVAVRTESALAIPPAGTQLHSESLSVNFSTCACCCGFPIRDCAVGVKSCLLTGFGVQGILVVSVFELHLAQFWSIARLSAQEQGGPTGRSLCKLVGDASVRANTMVFLLV